MLVRPSCVRRQLCPNVKGWALRPQHHVHPQCALGKRILVTLGQPPPKNLSLWCLCPFSSPFVPQEGGGGGATTIGPDATHPPAICQNLREGGGGSWGRGGGVGGRVGWGGIGSSAGGFPRGGGCARPTTTTCIPQGGVCDWGHGGIELWNKGYGETEATARGYAEGTEQAEGDRPSRSKAKTEPMMVQQSP